MQIPHEAILPLLEPMLGGGLLTLETVKAIEYRDGKLESTS